MNGATMPPIAPMTDAVLTPILRMMVGSSSALNNPMMVKEIVTADFATSVKPSLAAHITFFSPQDGTIVFIAIRRARLQ